MSYKYSSLGSSAASGAVTAAGIGFNLVKDPFLPEFACEVQRLSRLDAGQSPGRPCAKTPSHKRRSTVGVGLKHAVGPLRLFVWHKQMPWVLPLATAGVIAGIYMMGYSAGRRRRT